MPLFDDPEAMKQEVLKHISLGMPLDRARVIMQSYGFFCENRAAKRELACYAKKKSGALSSSQYRVWIRSDEQGRVSDIQVNCFGEGP
jgi:hypothetical protein